MPAATALALTMAAPVTVTIIPTSRPRGAGNATCDANRGIGTDGIKYNHLNLVHQVGVNGKTMRYNYDGAGSKLKMENGLDNTKYAGGAGHPGFEYNNANLLTRIAVTTDRTEEGRSM